MLIRYVARIRGCLDLFFQCDRGSNITEVPHGALRQGALERGKKPPLCQRRIELQAGVRRIKLHSNSEGFTVRRKVRLAAGHTETLDIKPRRGNLALNATPWAWVSVGKTSPSETPVRLKVYEGEYAVIFECPDGHRKRENARVVPGQTTSVSVNCR